MFKNRYIFHLMVILLLGFELLIFLWPNLFAGQIFSIGGVINSDFLLTNYPSFLLYRQFLIEGRLPWWVSSMGSGYPLVAGHTLGALYPLNLFLYRLFLPIQAFHWSLYIHSLVAAAGTYFLVFKLTKSHFSGALSAVAFALSGYMIGRLPNGDLFSTISLFPWLTLFYLDVTHKSTFFRWFKLVVAVALQILAGYIQVAYYGWIILALLGIFMAGFRIRRQLIYLTCLITAIFTALCLAAIQIVPTIELVTSANRSQNMSLADATIFIYPKEGFLSFFGINIPHTIERNTHIGPERRYDIKSFYVYYSYIGLIPLFLVLASLFWLRRHPEHLPIFFVTLICMLLTLGSSTPLFSLFWQYVPGMKYFRHSVSFIAFWEFFMVVLAGLGFAYFLNKVSKKKTFLIVLGWILVSITFVDLYIHNHNIQPTKSADFWLKPPEIVGKLKIDPLNERISGVPLLFNGDYINNWQMQNSLKNLLSANYSLLFNIPTSDARLPLVLNRQVSVQAISLPTRYIIGQTAIHQFLSTDKNYPPVELPDSAYKFLQIQAVKYVFSLSPLNHPFINKIWEHKLPATIEEEILGDLNSTGKLYKLPLTLDTIYVYKLKEIMPRAYFVTTAQNFSSSDLVLKEMLSEKFNPKNQIIIEGETPQAPISGTGSVRIVKDLGDRVELEASSDKGGYLYLVDTYYPGWKAYINNKKTKIYRANYAFRAVQVPKGSHRVVFLYDPLSRQIGVGVSVITLALLLSFFYLDRKINLTNRIYKFS